jgi:hypothetical protein
MHAGYNILFLTLVIVQKPFLSNGDLELEHGGANAITTGVSTCEYGTSF